MLAKAKKAGIMPIAQFNGGATGGLAFPLQNLMTAYGAPEPVNEWIFNKPGATIDTPDNLKAAQHLDKWIKAGYFAKDANSLDYATMMSRFIGGKALFIFDGDWESGNLDKQMPGNAGFFLMPSAEAGGPQAAMSAPLTYGIAAKAKNPDCAAFFLDWVATNDKARQIAVEVGGSHPMGPADAFMPPVERGHGHGRNAGRGREDRRGQWRDGLHRQRDRRDLRQELDPEPAEDGRGASRRRRACCSRCRRTTRARSGSST